MKSRNEKVNDLLKQKQKFESKFKRSIKTIKPEQKNEELKKFRDAIDDYTSKYELLKGNFMRDIDYIKMMETKILEKYKEFNTYKLEVLYDFEEMDQVTYDGYEKEILNLKQQKDKVILKNKKDIEDEYKTIQKIKREIKERVNEYPESSKEEQKQLYREIIEKKKQIFEMKQLNMDIIPIYDDTKVLSTIITNYNPIKELNLNALELKVGENVNLEELELLE
jgi:hypothetical protein